MEINQKILIIDDEKANLKILSETFKEDVDVILAKSGQQGLDKAIKYRPDLILLDIIMPDMDGFQVIGHLKSNPLTSNIPVIFVTGEMDVDKEERGIELGACDYIQKPFHVAIIKARVRLHLRMARQTAMLERLANIDPLTSIANRRLYDETFEHEWLRAIRDQSIFTLAVIDIDNFKQYNDLYGHAAGDVVLEKVAFTLSKVLKRPTDFIARYGGEEFVILLPNTDKNSAIELMNKCCTAISALNIKHEKSEDYGCITTSTGGISYLPTQQSFPQRIFELADDMLYQAKHQGKNCVVWLD